MVVSAVCGVVDNEVGGVMFGKVYGEVCAMLGSEMGGVVCSERW